MMSSALLYIEVLSRILLQNLSSYDSVALQNIVNVLFKVVGSSVSYKTFVIYTDHVILLQ